MKLLIIEDEPDLLSALKKGFMKKGFAVDTADDDEAGSYLAQINDYDVVVLDLNLPHKDVLEILTEIRERSQTQKVMILSARSSVPDKILGLDMGRTTILQSPSISWSLKHESEVLQDVILYKKKMLFLRTG